MSILEIRPSAPYKLLLHAGAFCVFLFSIGFLHNVISSLKVWGPAVSESITSKKLVFESFFSFNSFCLERALQFPGAVRKLEPGALEISLMFARQAPRGKVGGVPVPNMSRSVKMIQHGYS